MHWILLTIAGVSGLALGSFLNVAIHRVPRGESVVSPPSACPNCGSRVRPRDNVPVLSWLLLRGACRDCGEPISIRYPIVEAVTAALVVATVVYFGETLESIAFAVLAVGLVAVTAVDLDCRRIPTPLLVATAALGLPVLVAACAVRGEWWPLGRALVAAVACYSVMALIHIASPRGLGFGDVRLSALLGLYLGWLGPGHPFVGLFAGFLTGAVVGVGLLIGSRRVRGVAIPFGPFLALGAALAVVLGDPVIDWYLG